MSLTSKKIRITYIITDLKTGGAEMMLYHLLQQIDRQLFDCAVISLMDAGDLGEKISALDIPVLTLGMNNKKPNPLLLIRLIQWLHQSHPDLVQTWMYHADLLGGSAAWVNHIPVVWGIHNATLHVKSKPRTNFVVKICAVLSHFIPSQIISCSYIGKDIHITQGYQASKFKVIPNGFDVIQFSPDPDAHSRLCHELGVDETTPIIGQIARFDPQKDHQNLIKAARLLKDQMPDARFVLCGEAITWNNKVLANWIDAAGLRPSFYLLGRREDISSIIAGLDLLVSSSIGEAFPVVLGEAMACGVLCVATDVGDSAYIVGETGSIVPPENPQLLAQGMQKILSLSTQQRHQLGLFARERMIKQFNLPDIVEIYQNTYTSILMGNR